MTDRLFEELELPIGLSKCHPDIGHKKPRLRYACGQCIQLPAQLLPLYGIDILGLDSDILQIEDRLDGCNIGFGRLFIRQVIAAPT